MILGSLIISLLCFGNVQAREIFSFHHRKAANLDHDLQDESLRNSALYVYDVDHERDHLSIHVFVNAEARNALSDPASLWPDEKIPYKISEKFDSEEKETILEAMEEFKNKTCVRFEPRGNEETPFILIEPGSGCSSTVGKNEKGNVTLGKGCNDKGIITHELMHTLGFLHEHNRPDRDDYVEINWENIEEKYKQNFRKNSLDEVEIGNITYDYNSIMHYGADNFAKNRSIPTIITLKENVTIGQRDGFSENDIAKILERYGCGKAASDSTDKTTQKSPTKPTKSAAKTNKDPVQSAKILAQLDKMSTLTIEKTTDGQKFLHATAITRKIIDETTSKMITETKNKFATAIVNQLSGNKKATTSLATVAKLGSKTTLKFWTKAKLAEANLKPTSSLSIIPTKGHYRRYKRQAEQPIYISSEQDEDVEAPQIAESLEAESPEVVERLGKDSKLEGRRANSAVDDFRVRYEEWANQYQNWWNHYYKWIQEQKPITEPTMNIIVEDEPLLTQEHRENESTVEKNPSPTIIKTESQIAKNGIPEALSFRGGSNGDPSSANDPHRLVSVPTLTNIPCENPSKCSNTAETSSENTNLVTEVAPSNCVNTGTDSTSENATAESHAPCATTPKLDTTKIDSSPERGTTLSGDPCTNTSMTTPGCMKPGADSTGIATSQSLSSEAKTLEVSTSSSSSQAEGVAKPNSMGLISTNIDPGNTSARSITINKTPAGTTLSIVNSDSLAPESMTPGSTEDISPEKTTLESETSIDPGITTKFFTTFIENRNTETISTKSTPIITTEITNSVERTTFQSTTPNNSKPEILTTGSTEEKVDSEAIAPDATNLGSSITTADSSEQTALESVVSKSSVPRVPTTVSKATSVNSEAIAPEAATPGSSIPSADSSEQTTLESVVSISNDPGISTPKIPTTGSKAENVNSEAIVRDVTTTSSSSLKADSSEPTTLENLASTSSDTGRSSPEIRTSSVTSTESGNAKSNTESGGTNEDLDYEFDKSEETVSTSATSSLTTLQGSNTISNSPAGTTSERVTTDVMSATLTTANLGSPRTQSDEAKTLENMISTGSGSVSSISESPESTNANPIATEFEISSTMTSICESLRKTTLGNKIFDCNKLDLIVPERKSENSKHETKIMTGLTTEHSGIVISKTAAPFTTTHKSGDFKEDADRSRFKSKIVNDSPKIACKGKCGKIDESEDEILQKDSSDMILESRAMQAKPEGTLRPDVDLEFEDETGKMTLGSVDDETDSSASTVSNDDTESTTLTFQLAVEASEHSIPYHKIFMYQSIEGRTALSNPNRLWPNGVVPYEFSNKYNERQKELLLEGMQAIMNASCVKFVERKNEVSYISIEPEDKCQSVIGKQPGRSNVTISEGCYLSGTIVHELLHSLGFVHEHNRPDRDSYVIVVWENIIEEAKPNFKRYSENKVKTLDEEYDYESVMHYSPYEFAIDPDKPTLIPLQPGVKIGDKDGLSKKDILKLNTLYGCQMGREAKMEEKRKKDGADDISAKAQTLVQNLLKYFEMNFQRLFRSILRTIQKFRPVILNMKSKEEGSH